MFSLIAWAIIAIRAQDMQAQGASMIRAYAIGQGASTQALVGCLSLALNPWAGCETASWSRHGVSI